MYSNYEAPNDYRNYIKHHGIKGQKWGVKNGPPYPLDAKVSKAIKKGKNTKHGFGLDDVSNFVDEHPEAVEFAIKATPIVLMAAKMGIDAAADANKKNKMDKILEARNQSKGKIDKKTGLRLKTGKSTQEEDLKACNPLYSKAGIGRSANYNCGYCSFAYEMRRRGYDTIAKLSKNGINGYQEMKNVFPTAKPILCDPYGMLSVTPSGSINQTYSLKGALLSQYDPFRTKKITETFNTLSSQNNSRGILMITWGAGGGHATTYFTRGGNVYIADPQSGRTLKTNAEYLKNATSIVAYRTDNIPTNQINIDELKRFVQ